MSLNEVTIPYHYTARSYQLPFLAELERAIDGESDKHFFYLIWHRRSGKDKTCIADAVPKKLISEPCLVKYIYPTLIQGRENLWDGIGSDGFKYRDHIPSQIREGDPNETLMKMNIKGGSIFQVGGSDKPDSLRGGNPKLVVFSEWAEQDPYAWDVIEPILRENKGIAIFNTTPKGDNHARALFEYAKDNPAWFVQTLTANDTGIWTPQELESLKQDIIKRFDSMGRSEGEAIAYFEQEYLCSFNSPIIGSYYGDNIRKAEADGRITHVPCAEGIAVDTYWDLGIDDSMTIWFIQKVGQEFHMIDYYENSGEGLPFYAKILQDKKYLYGHHIAPHDIQVRELGTGRSRLEVAKSLGIKFELAPALSLDDGINAGRSVFSQCWFDKEKCNRGINALKNYTKEWDEKNKVFKNKPQHNWASHGADSYRMFAVGYRNPKIAQTTNFGGIKPYYPELGI